MRNSIDVVYSSLGRYTRTMEYHREALRIQLTLFSPDHRSLAITYRCIGIPHEKKR